MVIILFSTCFSYNFRLPLCHFLYSHYVPLHIASSIPLPSHRVPPCPLSISAQYPQPTGHPGSALVATDGYSTISSPLSKPESNYPSKYQDKSHRSCSSRCSDIFWSKM